MSEINDALKNGDPISQADLDDICDNAAPGTISIIRVGDARPPVRTGIGPIRYPHKGLIQGEFNTDVNSSPPPVPRLASGSGFRGPDKYRCLGSGEAPVIWHCSVTGFYLVGLELRIAEVLEAGGHYEQAITACVESEYRVVAVWQSNRGRYRDGDGEIGTDRVWTHRTRAPAARKFRALCELRLHRNRKLAFGPAYNPPYELPGWLVS